jgi:hypothetical protein
MVIVLILPFFQLLVEEVNVVRNPVAVEELIELLVVDAVGSFDLAVEMWVRGRMYTWRMSSASGCQWKWDWNSAPLSV